MERLKAENLKGGDILIPTIINQGKEEGFSFENLYLPKDWQKVVPSPRSTIQNILGSFKALCQMHNFIPGKAHIDAGSDLLARLSLDTDPISAIQLEESDNPVIGRYLGVKIQDIEAAILLQKVVATFLEPMWKKLDQPDVYSYLDGKPGAYYSANLRIPPKFQNPEHPLTDTIYQEEFRTVANRLAQGFGLELGVVLFDQKGVASAFSVDNRAYFLSEDGTYHQDSILDGNQAAALHSIGAQFINHLLTS